MYKSILIILGIIGQTLFARNSDTTSITIIASGETHAMLYPCDCPDNPGGGLAERAAALKKTGDSSALLLLDAGGFAGGGIYDDYTGGRAADSVRTVAVVRAMAAMKYAGAALGDDEFQYGGAWIAGISGAAGLPLVSANCFSRTGKAIAPAYRIVVRKGLRFAITAVSTNERLFPSDDSIIVMPPAGSIRKIWQEMKAASDCRIIIAHLGEEATAALADSFPDCDLMVNGHRKVTASPVTLHGKVPVMQFGYQGKKLSYVTIRPSKLTHPLSVDRSGWIDVGPAGGADSAVAALLTPAKGAATEPVYDLYIMGQCPYGCAALAEFVDFVKKVAGIEWNVWFIGSIEKDTLSSLHGRGEADDEMVWLAVKALYPAAWLPFLAARSRAGATAWSVVATLRLDTMRISAWVREHGRRELTDHYRRSLRLGVTASPTLFVNNVPFEKNIESRRLSKSWCTLTKGKGHPCDSLPECFDDADCRQRGKVGACQASGKCIFTPDEPFPFTVLVADTTLQHPEKTVIATTEELFPAVTIQTVTLSSDKGRDMMQAYSPASLPLYFFGAAVARAHNFARIESGLASVPHGFTFKNEITPKNYFPRRVRTAGTAALFVDPLFSGAVQAVSAVIGDSLLRKTVRILPVVYTDPAEAAPSMEEKMRREEALRWLVLDTLYARVFATYLGQWARDPGSSYWFVNLDACAIGPDAFVKKVTAQSGLLSGHWRLIDDLGIKEPVTMLLENRQFITIKNETELTTVLATLKPRAGKRP